MNTNQAQNLAFEASNEFLRFQRDLVKEHKIPLEKLNQLFDLKNQRDLWNYRYEQIVAMDVELTGKGLEDNIEDGG